MRCPKCGFNSFDHNLVCPKCRKDLTAARRLLNLSVPSPGAVDFFHTAAQRAVFPEPIPAEEADIQPEPLESIEPVAAAPAPEAVDDIEPLDDFDEIEPEDEEEDIAPLAEAEDIEDIFPAEPEEEEILPEDPAEEAEEITPLDSGDAFAGHLAAARAAVSPLISDEEIEIELEDEPEDVEIEPVADTFNAAATAPPEVATMLAQIKDTLSSTGDLQAEAPEPVEIEAENIAEPEAEPVIEAEAELLPPEEDPWEPEAVEIQPVAVESLMAEEDELEAPADLVLPELTDDIFEVTTLPTALTDEGLISLDDDSEEALSGLVTDFDVDDLENKM